jgi:hypothetical protein
MKNKKIQIKLNPRLNIDFYWPEATTALIIHNFPYRISNKFSLYVKLQVFFLVVGQLTSSREIVS